MPGGRPWYKDCDDAIEQAELCCGRGIAVTIFKDYETEAANYRLNSLLSLVYESNRLEDAGLSELDTRTLILEDDLLADIEKAAELSRKIAAELKAGKADGPGGPDESVISFKGKSRSAREVYQHYLAAAFAARAVRPMLEAFIRYDYLDRTVKHGPEMGIEVTEADLETLPRSKGEFQQKVSFLGEPLIRELHFLLARGLMDEERSGAAGHYRKHNVTTGDYSVVYLDHASVGKAMRRFVRQGNETLRGPGNPAAKAARISYDFLMIHPFPDFNGRLSRLLISMVLMAHGLPFFVTLRGDKGEKKRYGYALRRANKGDIGPYTCLIARAVTRQFDLMNDLFERAGLERRDPPKKDA